CHIVLRKKDIQKRLSPIYCSFLFSVCYNLRKRLIKREILMKEKKVYLAELREGDSDLFTKWQWDEAFAEGISYDVFHPFQKKDWEKMFDNSESNEEFHYTIRKISDDSLIGFISLSDVLLKNRRGELGIGIPAKENRGKGYGSEAIQCL